MTESNSDRSPMEVVLDGVRAEVRAWLLLCRTAALALGDVHHGRALIFDTEYDGLFTSLPGFASAVDITEDL